MLNQKWIQTPTVQNINKNDEGHALHFIVHSKKKKKHYLVEKRNQVASKLQAIGLAQERKKEEGNVLVEKGYPTKRKKRKRGKGDGKMLIIH